MTWGTFSIEHFISLIISILMILTLYFFLKNKKDKTKIIVLLVFSSFGIWANFYNLLKWGSPIEYLPLHMCNITAFLIPIVLITKNKYIANLLVLWSVGALIALIFNHEASNFILFTPTFLQYYLSHTFEFGIPILIFALKIIPLDRKTIPYTILITLIIYTVVHLINLSLNRYILINDIKDNNGNLIQVNYMFSIYPSNPGLQFLYNIIPAPYFYLLLMLPIFLIYLLIIYFPSIYKEKKTLMK